MNSTRRDWLLFAGLTFCFSFGFAVYTGIFPNFFREVIGREPGKMGLLESLREVPGLLTAFMAGTLAALAEARLAAVALVICAVGIAATGQTHDYGALILVTVFWSIGGHLWFSISPAITLILANGKEGGKYLGRMTGVGAVAVLLALGFTRVAKRYLSYGTLFYIGAVIILAGAVFALRLSGRARGAARQRLVFRREYGLYYLLTFLEGCRRQIFGTFAPFALIFVYRTSVETMLTLAFINAAVSTVSGPMMGRWVDRFGERPMMTLYYVVLIFVFTGYTWFDTVGILYALYLLDNLLFSFGIGLTTYLHRIARPADMTPSLAMGTTMNHIAAVLVPVTGGVLWKTTGNYRIPFLIGIGVVLLSLLAAQRLPVAAREEAAATTG